MKSSEAQANKGLKAIKYIFFSLIKYGFLGDIIFSRILLSLEFLQTLFRTSSLSTFKNSINDFSSSFLLDFCWYLWIFFAFEIDGNLMKNSKVGCWKVNFWISRQIPIKFHLESFPKICTLFPANSFKNSKISSTIFLLLFYLIFVCIC